MALPNEVNPLLASGEAAGGGGGGGYTISRSLRFNSADTPSLSRTLTATGNRTRFTFSAWVKRLPGTNTPLIAASPDSSSNNRTFITIQSTDDLAVINTAGGTQTNWRVSSALFRDPAAWYHVVVNVETSNATAANRILMWVNGVQITGFSASTNPTQNFATNFNNSGNVVRIGSPFSGNNADAYMADIHFIDGLGLNADQFGEFDATTGVWKPKAYTGTYGTNGFRLDFSDNSAATTTTLGKDRSGNNNDFTPANFSVAAGAGNDSVIDTPTNNFATLNPIDLRASDNNNASVSDGALRGTTSLGTGSGYGATIPVNNPPGGKYYWEVTMVSGITTAANAAEIGVIGPSPADGFATNFHTWPSSTSPNFTNGDVIGVTFDQTTGTLAFYKNGVFATQLTGITQTITPLFPAMRDNLVSASIVSTWNFGQQPFTYTPPSGFVALCTANLPVPSIVNGRTAFDTLLYTGNAASRNIAGLSFQPDFVWIKKRNSSTNSDHGLYDSVRGATRYVNSNATTDEGVDTQSLTGFNSNGFGLGNNVHVNSTGNTFVAYNWLRGATPGFDIVTYTGNGANRTIAHGLGAVPRMMMIKARTTAGTDQGWAVYHAGLGSPNTNWLALDASTVVTTGSTSMWNSTFPTSSVFSLGDNARVNTNADTYLAYLWSEVPGFSRIGSYVGNGNNDGTYVWCGFRPAFVLIKIATGVSGNWALINTRAATSNVIGPNIPANTNGVESSVTLLDITSNGFKIRSTTAQVNNNGSTYVFAAFAETPFKYALAR